MKNRKKLKQGAQFLEEGFELVDEFLELHEIDSIVQEFDQQPLSGRNGGVRNAEKKLSSVNKLVVSPRILSFAAGYVSDNVRLVRSILFNKTQTNNWYVAWHQDKTVAVTKEFDCPGWDSWSIKDGVWHAQPPLAVLNKMVTIRIHLDDVCEASGCLQVVPGSHLVGLLPQNQIAEYTNSQTKVSCLGKKGSALVMRPHLMHSSSKNKTQSERRVLHLEFSSYQLPDGVSWA